MKRFLLVMLALAAAGLITGCSSSTTYNLTSTSSGYSFCQEVTTSNSEVGSTLTSAGYQEGACSTQGMSATTCAYTAKDANGNSYTVTEYFDDAYAAYIDAACTSLGGTLNE